MILTECVSVCVGGSLSSVLDITAETTRWSGCVILDRNSPEIWNGQTFFLWFVWSRSFFLLQFLQWMLHLWIYSTTRDIVCVIQILPGKKAIYFILFVKTDKSKSEVRKSTLKSKPTNGKKQPLRQRSMFVITVRNALHHLNFSTFCNIATNKLHWVLTGFYVIVKHK